MRDESCAKIGKNQTTQENVQRVWVFQIVAIIKEFPAIATGDKMAMKTEAERDNAWKEKL